METLDASSLRQMRKEVDLTQRAFGEEVFRKIGRKISSAYAQKVVSFWERGLLALSAQEINAVAKVLGKSKEEIERATRRLSLPSLPSLDLLNSRVTREDLEFLNTVQKGLSQPMTIGLVLELLRHRRTTT